MIKYLAYLIIPIVIALIPFLIDRSVNRRIPRETYGEELPLVIGVSIGMYVVMMLGILFFSICGVAGLMYGKGAAILYFFLSLFFACLNAFGLWILKTCRAEITKDEFIVSRDRKKNIVQLKSIKSAFVANGHIHIDAGKKKLFTVPAYFKNTALMVSILNKQQIE